MWSSTFFKIIFYHRPFLSYRKLPHQKMGKKFTKVHQKSIALGVSGVVYLHRMTKYNVPQRHSTLLDINNIHTDAQSHILVLLRTTKILFFHNFNILNNFWFHMNVSLHTKSP